MINDQMTIEKRYLDVKYFEYLVGSVDRLKFKPVAKKKKRTWVIDLFMIIIIFISLSFFAFQSVKAVRTKIVVMNNEKKVRMLKNELSSIITSNKSLSDEIYSMVDQDYVKNTAFLRLSMYAPTEDNVIYFKKNNVGYVRHYGSVK